MERELPSLFAEGREALRRLLDIAAGRLRDRGIAMGFDPAVVEWLLGQPDWPASLNPLRTLDGEWHREVGRVIEGMLLASQLRAGDALWVGLSGDAPDLGLRFVVETLEGTGK